MSYPKFERAHCDVGPFFHAQAPVRHDPSNVYFRWPAYGSPLAGIWKPAGRHMEAHWPAHGSPMAGTWEPAGRHMAPGMSNQ